MYSITDNNNAIEAWSVMSSIMIFDEYRLSAWFSLSWFDQHGHIRHIYSSWNDGKSNIIASLMYYRWLKCPRIMGIMAAILNFD